MSDNFSPHPSYLAPPISQPLSIPELYDWHYQNNQNHPLYVYEDAPGTLRFITMGEAVQAFHRATRFINERIQVNSPQQRIIVAILAWSETISYVSTVIGILRAGFIAFPISPRNDARAIAHLLSSVSATHLVVSPEQSIQSLSEGALGLLKVGLEKPRIIEMPTYETFFLSEDFDPAFKPVPMAPVSINSIACVYHTSGTTALPEPIYLTHRALYCFSTVPTYSEIKLTGLIYGCHSIPIFHGMGWMPMTFPTSVGLTISVFKPCFPPAESTPDNVLQAALSVKTDIMLCAPTLVEAWAGLKDSIKSLAEMRGVVVGGAPLTKVTGDKLASNGVNIICQYGTTQTALLSQFISDAAGMDWEYFKFSPGWEIRMKDYGNGFFEAIVLDSEAFKPYICNSTFEDIPAYATGDLLEAHPTLPNKFRVAGRTEEQIKHPDGKMTNPTPIEHILNKDAHVESSIVFGHGQQRCGVLIQPRKDFLFDITDPDKLESFRDMIMPTIERANGFSPAHSKITKDMIIVASAEKPFQYTLKQTLRRQIMINAYAKEISDHYALVSKSS